MKIKEKCLDIKDLLLTVQLETSRNHQCDRSRKEGVNAIKLIVFTVFGAF